MSSSRETAVRFTLAIYATTPRMPRDKAERIAADIEEVARKAGCRDIAIVVDEKEERR